MCVREPKAGINEECISACGCSRQLLRRRRGSYKIHGPSVQPHSSVKYKTLKSIHYLATALLNSWHHWHILQVVQTGLSTFAASFLGDPQVTE